MRTKILFLALMVALTGCKKSDKPTTETRDLQSFESIVLRGVGQLRIHQGKAPAIEISGSEREVAEIKTEVRDGELIIEPKDPVSALIPLVYNVTVDKLEAVELAGAGQVISEGTLVVDSLDLRLSGNGSAHLILDVDKIETTISGSGKVFLQGSGERQELKMSGMGTYDAEDLQSKSATITLSGAGSVELGTLEELDVKISGAGRITYDGEPKVTQQIFGAGSVAQRTSDDSPKN